VKGKQGFLVSQPFLPVSLISKLSHLSSEKQALNNFKHLYLLEVFLGALFLILSSS
jgi:hypothetical protein